MTDPTDKDKIRARMLKMLALAEDAGATGGESDTARRMLDTLMAKHGMTLDDLTGEQKPIACRLGYGDAMDKELLFAVINKVTNKSIVRFVQVYRKREIRLELTPAQRVECEVLMQGYRAALKRHMNSAFVAFLMRNGIHSDGSDAEDNEAKKEPKKQDKEPRFDFDESAAASMAAGMTPTIINKQIEA